MQRLAMLPVCAALSPAVPCAPALAPLFQTALPLPRRSPLLHPLQHARLPAQAAGGRGGAPERGPGRAARPRRARGVPRGRGAAGGPERQEVGPHRGGCAALPRWAQAGWWWWWCVCGRGGEASSWEGSARHVPTQQRTAGPCAVWSVASSDSLQQGSRVLTCHVPCGRFPPFSLPLTTSL